MTAEQAHPAAQTPASGLRDDFICLYISFLSWRHRARQKPVRGAAQTVAGVRDAQQARRGRSCSVSVLGAEQAADSGPRTETKQLLRSGTRREKGENISDTMLILSCMSCPLIPAAQPTHSVRHGDSKCDLHRHPGMFEEKGGGAHTDTNQHSSSGL